MAPIMLNSVAPCWRASSRNRLGENRSSSTTLAPIAIDPSNEYAGALMWKIGSAVMSRSSGVSPTQDGNPSAASV